MTRCRLTDLLIDILVPIAALVALVGIYIAAVPVYLYYALKRRLGYD